MRRVAIAALLLLAACAEQPVATDDEDLPAVAASDLQRAVDLRPLPSGDLGFF
mgnify:CR=1 FL=1